MIRLFFIFSMFFNFQAGVLSVFAVRDGDFTVAGRQTSGDTLLNGIQEKIQRAFRLDMSSGDNKNLSKISIDLEKLYKEKKENIVRYWQGYNQFYISVFYFGNGDKKAAKKEIDKGIRWIEEMDNKNSEDYALLSMLQGFGIQFKGMRAMFIASRIKRNAKKAIELDSMNLRAYYVYGSNDFYKPKRFGGGKECERYLLKAISLPSIKSQEPYLPSWGREESYELLIRYYLRENKPEKAMQYYKEAIRIFPRSYILSRLYNTRLKDIEKRSLKR